MIRVIRVTKVISVIRVNSVIRAISTVAGGTGRVDDSLGTSDTRRFEGLEEIENIEWFEGLDL